MKALFRTTLLILLLFFTLACLREAGYVLLDEDFSLMPRGPLGSDSGAHTEYHYLPEAAPDGPWAVSTFRYNLPASWEVRERAAGRELVQDAVNPDRHWHPMVIAGDELWRDYTAEISYTPEDLQARTGMVFRYRNDRCYYFFGIEQGRLVLLRVHHGTGFRQPAEKLMAEAPLPFGAGEELSLFVHVSGTSIMAGIGGSSLFQVSDSLYPAGKIGLLADAPAAFHDVKVWTTRRSKQAFRADCAERAAMERERLAANPGMKCWKKISMEGFGVGRNLRFGDLDGDGVKDVLIGQVRHHGPKDRNSELACLTAMTLEGEVLWQTGSPDPWKTQLTSDVAFQIHDLDGDGHSEVVYCMNQEMVIAEGHTGRVLKRSPTPLSPGGKPLPSGHNIFTRILGDCLYFCDLQGRGYDGDVILKDRYRYLWAYDDALNLRWRDSCNTGHYPFAADVDGDGRDELLAGYTLFDDDGRQLWSLDDRIQDHADGVAIVPYREGEDPLYMCAASDEGMFFADLQGQVLRHHYIGHVQNPAVANIRDDLPGLETISVNFWGNQGIIHLFDSEGEVYADLEPNQYGSMCLPLNWTGRSEEYFLLNANVEEGGAWDGHGQRVLVFPDDGHPDMCYAVLDLTGDCRDEIVVWDPHEIWIYTQDDNPLEGQLYRPQRNPLYNYSNYQATVSLPGWSDGPSRSQHK